LPGSEPVSAAEREKEIFKGQCPIWQLSNHPLETHQAAAPCRRSKNKPLWLALPASNDSLLIARANAAMWCAAPTPRERASLATICETAPNTRHDERYHPLSRMPAARAAWRYLAAMGRCHEPVLFSRVRIEQGKIGQHVCLAALG
jgi:hypothetical protein